MLSKITLLKKRIVELLGIANFDHIKLDGKLDDMDECEIDVAKFVELVNQTIDAQDVEMDIEPKESIYPPLPKSLEALLLNAPDPFQSEQSAIQLTFEPPKKGKSGRKKKIVDEKPASASVIEK